MKEQILVGTNAKRLEADGVSIPLPSGAIVGVIVDREDWENPRLQGIYGEAVLVRESQRQVTFPLGNIQILYTVFKDESTTKTLAGVVGREILWMQEESCART